MNLYDKHYHEANSVLGVNQEKRVFPAPNSLVHFRESIHGIHYRSDFQKTILWQSFTDSIQILSENQGAELYQTGSKILPHPFGQSHTDDLYREEGAITINGYHVTSTSTYI
jgi:hypothetical protein